MSSHILQMTGGDPPVRGDQLRPEFWLHEQGSEPIDAPAMIAGGGTRRLEYWNGTQGTAYLFDVGTFRPGGEA